MKSGGLEGGSPLLPPTAIKTIHPIEVRSTSRKNNAPLNRRRRQQPLRSGEQFIELHRFVEILAHTQALGEHLVS